MKNIEYNLTKSAQHPEVDENVRRSFTMKTCTKCKVDKLYSEYSKRYAGKLHSECKECLRKRAREDYYKNIERRRALNNVYYQNNKQTIRANEARYRKERCKIDPGFKLIRNLRSRLYIFFRRSKNSRTLDFLGCTLQDFKIYLEAKFKPGMTWKNYGKDGWEIDHIFPLSKMNCENQDDIKKYLHYTNLQPLWKVDNLKKGNKV